MRIDTKTNNKIVWAKSGIKRMPLKRLFYVPHDEPYYVKFAQNKMLKEYDYRASTLACRHNKEVIPEKFRLIIHPN